MQFFRQSSHNLAPDRFLIAAAVSTVAVAIGIAIAPVNALWIGFALLSVVIIGWHLLKYPILAIPIVLLIGPLGAYEARAGWPIIGRLPIASGQIAFGALMLFWLITWLVRKERSLPQAKSFTWLLGFAAVMLITVLSAESVADGAKEVIKWIQLGMMMLICLDLVAQTTKRWESPQNGVWLLVTFVAVAGLAQAAIGINQFLAADGPESFQILGRFYRAFGTFEQPNPYGGYMAWTTVFMIGVCLPQIWAYGSRFLGLTQAENKNDEPMPILWLLVLLGITVILGGALIASWSRGAWLAAVIGCGAMAFFLPKNRWVGVGLIFSGILALFFVFQLGLIPASISDRLASSTEIEFADLRDQEVSPANFAVLERQAFWQAAFGMFESDIWTGVGFGNYDAAYPDHFVGRWEKSLGHAHNYYINLLAETGIIGLLAYLIFWSAIFWQILRKLPELSLSQRGLALGLIGLWAALAAHHLVDNLYVNHNWFILGLFLAIQEMLLGSNVMIPRGKLNCAKKSVKLSS